MNRLSMKVSSYKSIEKAKKKKKKWRLAILFFVSVRPIQRLLMMVFY